MISKGESRKVWLSLLLYALSYSRSPSLGIRFEGFSFDRRGAVDQNAV
jgi:hypothetical protein